MDKNASKLDLRCSTACTRAGLTALIFSIIALSMMQPLIKLKAFMSLRDYVLARVFIKESLDEFYKSSCWNEWQAKKGVRLDLANKWSLSKIQEETGCGRSIEIYSENNKLPLRSIQLNKKTIIPSNKEAKIPSYKVKLNFFFSLDSIASEMTKLGDNKLLSSASSFSPHYLFSINRWVFLRSRLLEKNDFNGNTNDYAKYLSLGDIKELAEYEYPSISDIETFYREQQIALPNIATPLQILPGTVAVETGLLFSLIYFWLFQSEAKQSPSYPAAGTLWGVFLKTYFTRTIFLIFIFIPIVAGGLLAYLTIPFNSDGYVGYINCGLALCILLFSIVIVRNSWSLKTKNGS